MRELCEPGLMYEDDKKLRLRVDIDKVKQVSEIELGDTVEVVVKGKVTRMQAPEHELRKDYSKPNSKKLEKHTYPGTLEVEITSMSVKSEGDFDGMLEDES